MSARQVAALVLAAGQSRRMGRPKMLLPWGGSSVLAQVVSAFALAGPAEIVVVTGAEREQVEALLAGLTVSCPLRSIHNPGYADGEMLASLQCGLAGLGPQVEAALVGLGDQPQLQPETVGRILQAFERSAAGLIVPSYQMRRGHPWLVGRQHWAGLQALAAPHTPRDFLRAHAAEIEYVEVDTPSVLADLDTPEDYRRHL